jgi:hypothetical protein
VVPGAKRAERAPMTGEGPQTGAAARICTRNPRTTRHPPPQLLGRHGLRCSDLRLLLRPNPVHDWIRLSHFREARFEAVG